MGRSFVQLLPAPATPPARERAPSLWPSAPSTLASSLPGRLSEIARSPAGGQSSLAASLVAAGQRRGQLVAWIQASQGPLYPPDLAAAGVDVAALVVLHVGAPSEPALRLRAAEWLLSGGGFGLVVVDLNDGAPSGLAWQGRLLQLARQYRSSVLLLTAAPANAASLGALISLRLWPQPAVTQATTSSFDLATVVLKSKAGPLPSPLSLLCCGPLELQG